MSPESFIQEHPFVTCEINTTDQQPEFVGRLTYRGYESGRLYGPTLDAVTGQFRVLCDLIDQDGAMLRRGTVMLGYHNGILKGDVLLPDGEIVGFWEMEEDDDTSHFTPEGETSPTLCAPSSWMLQDVIADHLNLYRVG